MKRVEIGCYGDGRLGHQHTRECCAEVLEYYFEAFHAREESLPGPWDVGFGPTQLIAALNGEMSDDAQEEYDACDWLNDHAAVDGHLWSWDDGDFGLWPDMGDE